MIAIASYDYMTNPEVFLVQHVRHKGHTRVHDLPDRDWAVAMVLWKTFKRDTL
jgi:hypothetical protein